MAFPGTPLDVRTELQIGGVWTDITADVHTRSPIGIEYGRSEESVRTNPAKLGMEINNRSGRYSPRNPMSPYYGLIGRNTPVRVSVKGSESYLALDETRTGTASTPDHASLAITDLDVRFEGEIDWYSSVRNQTLLGQWGADGNRGWSVRVLDGLVTVLWTTSGSVATQFYIQFRIPALPRRAALRLTLDVDNGAGGYTAAAYWARSLDGPWTQIDTFSATGAMSIFNSTAALEMGPTQTGTIPPRAPFVGRGYRAEVRSGINGTVVASPDFRALAEGTASFADSTGKTWSINGTAKVTDREYRFYGDVSAWPARWDVSGRDVWVPIEAAGVLRRLGQGTKALDSTLRRRIPSGNPLAYWPLEEGAAATRAPATSPTVAAATFSGLDWAADDTLPGSAPLPKLKNPASLRAQIPGSPTAGWHVECVYHLPTMPTTQTEILRVNVAGSVMRTAAVYASTAGIRVEARAADDSVIAYFLYSDPAALAAFTNVWNRLQLFTSDAGGGQTLLHAAWLDVSTMTWSYARTIYTGTMGSATQITGTWGAATEGMTIGHLAAFAVAGTSSAAGVTIYDGADDGFAGEQATTRMLRLAGEESGTVYLSVVKGSTKAEAVGPQRPDALLELLQDAADVDGGILTEALDASALVYRDRNTLYNQAPALVLDYQARGEVGPPLEPIEDDQKTRNDVTVTREGGSFGRAVSESGPLSVKAPPNGVGLYDEQVTLNLHRDEQAGPIAGWRLHLGTWDEARYPTVRLMLHAAPHLIPAYLKLRAGDRIQITNPPPWLPPGPIDLIVQGWAEVLDQYTWDVVLNCTPAGTWTVGVVDDLKFPGTVDTDGSQLAAAATSTATTLSVATPTGPLWVTAAPNTQPDPGFEAGTGTWQCTRGTSIGVVSWERGITHSGAGTLRITRVHPTDTGTLNLRDITNGIFPAAPGQVWAGSAWVYSGGAAANAMRVAIVWRDSLGVETFIYGAAPSVTAGYWQQLTASATLPAGAVSVRLAVEGRSAWTVGEWWLADDIRLARTDTLVGPDMFDEFPFDAQLGGEVVRVHGISGTTNPQTWYVDRSRNGIVKAQTSGIDVRLAQPARVAL